jgi:hypothetical protein
MVFALVVLCPAALSTAEKPDWNGYWWASMTPDFKLGWVAGYAKAMDEAYSSYMVMCAGNLPLYAEKYPGVPSKDIVQKMCINTWSNDYHGISMGQFVDGMNAFYADYRNKQLEVAWAIQYVRDAIKGKPAQELEAEVALWRRCSAADQSHPMPRSSEDAAQINKACSPDNQAVSK